MKKAPLLVFSVMILMLAGLYAFGVFGMVFPEQQTVLPVALPVADAPLDTFPVEREEKLTTAEAVTKAQEFEKKGLLAEGIETLLAVEKQGNTDMAIAFELGRLFKREGKYEQASGYFQKVLEASPQDAPTLIELLHMNLLLEQYQAFDVLYPQVPEQFVEKKYYQGLYFLLTGREQEGYEIFKGLVGNTSLDRLLASNSDRVVKAFDEFKLYSGGSGVHLKTIIARSLVENGELVLAERLLKGVITEKKDYVDSWVLLGYTYYLQKSYDFAETAFGTAYALNSISPDIQFYLGITKEKQGMYSEALQYLSLAQENGYEPQVEVQRRIADLYVETQEYEKAVALYEVVLDVDSPKEMAQYVRPLWIYIDLLKTPDRALELALEAKEKYPDDAMAYNLLGWAYLAKKDYGNAETNLLLALSKDRGLSAAYLNLGKLYEETGKLDNAKKFYQRAYFMDQGTSVGNTAAELYNNLLSRS